MLGQSPMLVLTCALLVSCTSTQPGPPAPAEVFEPAGWLDVGQSLSGDSFADYEANVRHRLETARLPFDSTQAELELNRAAPVQIDPVETCGDDLHGIVLLVHGLSDTAFAMRDLAEHFASRCHIARTVLLPGHGTRAGDLLVVNHTHWTDTVRHLVSVAAKEHENITLVGFSLGAVITTTVALDENSPVDRLVAFSPAYAIGQWRLARLAPYLHWLRPWIDRGPSADALRYEAMPTKAVGELVKARRVLGKRLRRAGPVEQQWLMVQSLDDDTIVPDKNREFVLRHGENARVLEYYSGTEVANTDDRVTRYSGIHIDPRVNALSHASVHIAPDNPHYGLNGEYRICGIVDGRNVMDALVCEQAETVFYTVWARLPAARPVPAALSSFNPHFDDLMISLDNFIEPENQR